MGKRLLLTISLAASIFLFTVNSWAANTMSDWGKCMVANDGKYAIGICGPDPDAPAPAQAPASESTSETTTVTSTTATTSSSEKGFCLTKCPNGCDQAKGFWDCIAEPSKSETPKATETKPPKPSPSEVAQKCLDNNSDAIEQCTSGTNGATNSCNVDNNSALGTAIEVAAAVTLGAGAYTGASVQAACSSMGKLSAGSNGALAAYRLACSNGQNTCASSCSNAKKKVDNCASNSEDSSDVKKAMADLSDYKIIKTAASKCGALKGKVDQATQALQNMAQTATLAQNCTTATSGLTAAAAVPDCTDPTFAATNQVCICQANPRSPGCTGGEATTTSNSGLTGFGDLTTSATSNVDLPGITPDNNLQELKASLKGEDVGGRKGAGAPIGSVGAFDGNGGGPRGGKSDDLSKYGTNGFYGGTGNGGASTSAGSGARSGSKYSLDKDPVARVNRPDLRQFLPGGKNDPQRGIAGATGPDGITGPNTNIWLKIQNRYRTQTPSLYEL